MKMKEFDDLLNEYFDRFDRPFPLMMCSDPDEAAKMIKESFEKDTIVDDLYPKIFKVDKDAIV